MSLSRLRALVLLSALITVTISLVMITAPASSDAKPKPAVAGWRWTATGKLPSLNGGSADNVSCASTTYCAVAGSTYVYATTKPAGKASSWTRTKLATNDELGFSIMTEVECPKVGLCIAADDRSNLYTSTNPTGGASAWPRTSLPSGTYVGITALSCGSATLCAAFDTGGLALTTVNPSGFGSAWTATAVNKVNAGMYEIGCTASRCVGVQASGTVWVSTNPSAQPATWTKVSLGSGLRLNTATCGSSKVCIVAGYKGNVRVATSSSPTTKGAWKTVAIPGTYGIDHVECKSDTLCFALSGSKVYVSTNPAKAGSWKQTIDTKGVILSDISCGSARSCVLIDVGGRVWVGSRA